MTHGAAAKLAFHQGNKVVAGKSSLLACRDLLSKRKTRILRCLRRRKGKILYGSVN